MRIALGIEYDGTGYLGWQRLSHGSTLQAAVEQAVSFVADHPVQVTCAGRTDAGVHARCQVVHFDTDAARSPRAWALGCSSRLPNDIAVVWACPVADDFHARFRAVRRAYRYAILNRPVRPALEARFVAWERLPLDAERMHEAAQALVGEHDFSAFRSIACQAHHPRRTVYRLEVRRQGEQVLVEVEANAFLHHMVRNIIGTLLPVGRGERQPAWVAEVLAGGDRTLAGPTAEARGLTFLGPRYPAGSGLPAGLEID
ncbi:MAG TPA: tRNA pseudouridine(38-40) synthase TruA [Xanthomonadaceae bacterium]|nr:tRNA pseudouridine(38-40) synthase TruA [Xanthomonadaceae bacterium]